MTYLWNDPNEFADEMTLGFVRANARYVQAAAGGVTRSTQSETAEVALVTGGGSGHYPAFAGLVGPGMAHGAAMGNLFASPSAQQVANIARASNQDAGVMLAFGNYAGDLLNFSQAKTELESEGYECALLAITDDIASAPATERHKRRGIGGSLAVYKCIGAAAQQGMSLAEVKRIAVVANDNLRSLGITFDGCRLPGSVQPLCQVTDGNFALGLGIHGEPGLQELEWVPARSIASILVDKLTHPSEVPGRLQLKGRRVVPILNGLGGLKYEELFVLFNDIADHLEAKGIVLVDPQVGEFCTSFDMAGGSLSLFWLDAELEDLWTQPCDTPAFSKTGTLSNLAERVLATQVKVDSVPLATPASQALAAKIVTSLALAQTYIEENTEMLGKLDSIAGDGDHGIGMLRGVRAAYFAAQEAALAGAGAHSVLARAGIEWADKSGGTSGAIWGLILRTAASALSDSHANLTNESIVTASRATLDAVCEFGGATVGDKTMVDALAPFVATLSKGLESGMSLRAAWQEAQQASVNAAEQTANIIALHGRARTHGTRSLGSPDPGAVSLAGILNAVQGSQP